jgi:hypothetical protein
MLALLAVSLSIPGTHPLALLLFWMCIVGEEVWSGLARRPAVTLTRSVSAADDDFPPGVSQQLTRATADGVESITARLRVSFASGQQNETVHVAFCPPLDAQPTATCKPLRGAACEIKIAEVATYGARLELKRRGELPAAAEVVVELSVQAAR